MARICRYCRTVATVLGLFAGWNFAPALAQDQNVAPDLYDRPVLAIDPGMHTNAILGQAVDREGKYAVTGSSDGTVRIWSVADGELLRTIWIPAGPDKVGAIYAAAISPDGLMVAAGGFTYRKHLRRLPSLYIRSRLGGSCQPNSRRSPRRGPLPYVLA
jgi:hypothetical protein